MAVDRIVTMAAVALVATLAGAPAAEAAMPAVGRPAPDFTLRSSSGKNLRLSEYRGQVVMVNFWASWCSPCRQELPLLNRLHEQYRRAGFTLLGVSVDDNPKTAEAMARQLGVGFPVLFDAGKQVSGRYDVDTMPATLLIDRDGKVRHVHRGYRAGYEKQYEAQLKELLRQ